MPLIMVGLCLLLPITSIGASQQTRVLTPKEVQTEQIKGGESHTYTMSLLVEQFVQLTIRRHGIDVKVKVTALNESKSLEFENPAGPESPLFVLFKAKRSGTYVVEVTPSKKWLPLGRYEIESTFPSSIDENKLLAQTYVLEGRQQQRQDTDESRKLALASYEKALALWKQASDDFEAANTLQRMGQMYKAWGDLDGAENCYKKALELRVSDRDARPYTMAERADAYYSLKSPGASQTMFEEARDAFRETGNKRGEAMVLSQLGLVHMRLSEWVEALPILETSLAINRAEGDGFEEMRVLNSLGGVYDNQAEPQPEKAWELFKKASEGFHAFGDFVREGNAYINIGLHHDSWGEFQQAIDSYTKALELLELGLKNGDADQSYVKSKKAYLFYNLGALYVSLANFDEGRKYLQQSLDLYTPNERGGPLYWFGYAAVLDGKPNDALAFCQQALDIQIPAKDPRRAQTYTIMGMAYHDLGDYDKAIEYYNHAFEIQDNKDTPDQKNLAITMDHRAESFAARGKLTEARNDIGRALINWRIFKDREGEAISLFRLARIERGVGNIKEGLKHASEAIKIAESLRRNLDDPRMRSSYFSTKVDYYDTYIDLLMLSRDDVAKNSTTAFEASEQRLARVLLDTLSHPDVQQQLLTNPKLNDLVTKQVELRRSIFSKFSLRSEAILKDKTDRVAELDGQIASLSSERSNVESQIRTEYPEYAELMSPRPLAADEIQKQLDPDTQLLEFALGEKRSYAWVVTGEKIQGFELAPRKEIEALATRLLQAITERNRKIPNETPANTTARWKKADQEYANAAAALSKLILTPLAPALQRERLVVVADGALQLAPFGLLPDPVTSSHLIAKHEIVSLPSASVLALQRQELANRRPAPLGVAIVADPVFELKDQRVVDALAANKKRKNKTPVATAPTKPQNETLASALRSVGADDGLHRLMMSRTEAADIARVVPKNQLFEALDFRASRATVMGGELSKYRYVHLATHGVIDLEHPELSGVVLSMVDESGKEQDGYVRLYEIYNLNLPAELVVLSACQTGVGKQMRGEGLMALTRGFMYAGAARIVASLWKVNDSATAALMAQFYKEMFTNGKKPAAALRAAQKYMSEQTGWQSPYFWAGFILQGEWR